MKVTLLLPAIAVALLFAHCGNADQSTTGKSDDSTQVVKPDSIDTAIVATTNDTTGLKEALVQMYTWQEGLNAQSGDFSPATSQDSDSAYSGIDLEEHRNKLKQLRASGFFYPSFLVSYDAIAMRMDRDLRNGTVSWLVGDMSPYYDASPWCNCQDYPTDDYLRHIELTDVSFTKGQVAFAWTWGPGVTDSWSGFKYHVRAIKENGRWLFSYLEGFDYYVLFPEQTGE